ncbi:unnamed protein product [Polarella glacialis]|uniref:WW domain-containing protein n=1 Tax=Polarella glacialis TaxID=89957 RepID=A0A813HLB9_POLGL|nr:unnamed protein product [Polarella glacialis]
MAPRARDPRDDEMLERARLAGELGLPRGWMAKVYVRTSPGGTATTHRYWDPDGVVYPSKGALRAHLGDACPSSLLGTYVPAPKPSTRNEEENSSVRREDAKSSPKKERSEKEGPPVEPSEREKRPERDQSRVERSKMDELRQRELSTLSTKQGYSKEELAAKRAYAAELGLPEGWMAKLTDAGNRKFWAPDGSVFRSITELQEALGELPEAFKNFRKGGRPPGSPSEVSPAKKKQRSSQESETKSKSEWKCKQCRQFFKSHKDLGIHQTSCRGAASSSSKAVSQQPSSAEHNLLRCVVGSKCKDLVACSMCPEAIRPGQVYFQCAKPDCNAKVCDLCFKAKKVCGASSSGAAKSEELEDTAMLSSLLGAGAGTALASPASPSSGSSSSSESAPASADSSSSDSEDPVPKEAKAASSVNAETAQPKVSTSRWKEQFSNEYSIPFWWDPVTEESCWEKPADAE